MGSVFAYHARKPFDRRHWTREDEAQRMQRWLELDRQLIARGLAHLAVWLKPSEAELALEPKSSVVWQ